MASLNRMGQLLSWATENKVDVTDPAYVPPRPMEEIDPGLVDMILGKPDIVRMKEAMKVALDERKDEGDRVQALDDLELLIESLDNANDMEAAKLWEPLLSLIDSPSADIAMQALWVAGTAIQNNPKSQAAFLSHDPFPGVITALSNASAEVRAKAMYTLSGALKHNRSAVVKFTEAKGWTVLKAALGDSSIAVRRKAAFLLNTLLLPDADLSSTSTTSPLNTSDLTRAAITSDNILPTLTSSIVSPTPFGPNHDPTPDIDFEEKAIRAIVTYLQGEPQTTEADHAMEVKKDVKVLVQARRTERGESWTLDPDDWETLEKFAG